MIANHRYLQASLFSFCIHAVLFLYIYGTFDSSTPQTLLISKPLQIELKFDLPSQDSKEQIPTAPELIATPVEQASQDNVYSKATELVQTKQNNALIKSNIANLLLEESEIELDRDKQEISIYAQKIISTIESAWMKPRNIPKDLVANLRLQIRPSGRIIGVDLVKSSGNIRFDNSALQAVRRVETFSFFNSIPKNLYESDFQIISISFNPS
jgi:colicin import membrane protein